MAEKVVTVAVDTPLHAQLRYPETEASSFEPAVFDEYELDKRQLLQGRAAAGRGNTAFFSWAGRQLVLRHYRRGGMMRHISADRYMFTGFERSRPILEFNVLFELQNRGLPVPRPYACCVTRQGLFYTASLVTYRLPGLTLTEWLQQAKADREQWSLVGRTIARFHRAGVCHADLNAHNILIDENNKVSLIDFDRATLRSLPADAVRKGWCLRNLDRLERSVMKVSKNSSKDPALLTVEPRQGFKLLQLAWADELGSMDH